MTPEKLLVHGDGVRLHAERWGTRGPALILGHGFGGSGRNFRPQARVLSDRARVLLFDARGHGRSDAPPDLDDYAPERFVADLDAVVAAAGDAPAVVGGLSMGAGLALRYALARPARVAGLVLAAFPRSADDPGHVDWALGFADSIERDGLDQAGRVFVWGEQSRFDPQGAELIRRGFAEHQPRALAFVLRRLLSVQPSAARLRAELGRLRVPTLVVVGSEDASSLGASHALAEMIPRARLIEIPGGSHVVNLSHPDECNAALGEFLEEVLGGRVR